jgi:uncharacterized Zn-binding protein involved in type VI secretion
LPNAITINDVNDGGGVLYEGAYSVLIEGLPAGRIGDYVTGHDPDHDPNPIVTGVDSVIVEYAVQAVDGSLNDCGHSMISSHSSVVIGG